MSNGESMSYSQMITNMRLVASGLRKKGCASGDSTLIIASNHTEILLMMLGVWRAGGTIAVLSVSLH